MERLPVAFVSHGAPVLLEDSEWMKSLKEWGRSMGEISSILVLSAHWVTSELMMGPLEEVPLIYDFWGFPDRFYEIGYAAPIALDLSEHILGLQGIGQIIVDRSRGLDHGMWVPLKGMFPSGRVPVLGLSLPGLSPRTLFDLGVFLAPLRRRGVLILCSGGITHNLSSLDPDPSASPVSWAGEFEQWIEAALLEKNVEGVLDFENKAPYAKRAHPTSEHLAPLFVALGAAQGYSQVLSPLKGVRWGTLSLHSFQFED